jgi:hypothetical protein|tara:strand:- start:9 stop:263 length:255 start_codon:yes stop_codon:yes gene_type:complete
MSVNKMKVVNIQCDGEIEDGICCQEESYTYQVERFSDDVTDVLKDMRKNLHNWIHDEKNNRDYCVGCAGSAVMDRKIKNERTSI